MHYRLSADASARPGPLHRQPIRSSWAEGPAASFATIREARQWAEEFGTTADRCTITDRGRAVVEHRRDTNGDGTRWYRATP